jgi:DNA mismatch repair protein MutS
LDELGRGTSTFDGMSLAYALTVNLCQLWVKTLFATHYHELIQLQEKQKRFSNRQVSVIETDRDVVFMKKIIRWGADKSYGLHVARRAWIPDRIVDVAQEHLDQMFHDRDAKPQQIALFKWDNFSTKAWWSSKYDLLIEKINALEITTMTPVDALVHLHQLKIQILQMTSTDS